MNQLDKAIIIGGGIAGKLAARVLSEFYNEIIILERDPEPTGPVPRKGAPQGNHIHALLHAGENGLEALFPGISKQCHESGAVKINSTKDLAWYHHGVWKLRYDGGYSTTLQTRPHLEWQINEFIKRIPNITIQYNTAVENFLYEKEQNRIIGVELKDGESSKTTLEADLIVDTSGSGSFTAGWLEKQGVQVPDERVKIGLCYVSKTFHLPPAKKRDWEIKLVYPNPPAEKIAGAISKVEGNRFIGTFIGYHGAINEKEVLKNDDNFIDLAKKLPKLDLYEELQDATDFSPTSIYRVPSIVWRKIHKVKALPTGLLLMGDTVCRIDPFFGQGMSIAVLEALALRKLLQQGDRPQQEIIKAFHKQEAKIIAPIWNMVLTEDFRYPATTGKKPAGLPFLQWYAKQIFLLSAQNRRVYDSFIKVMNLVRPMTILMQPGIIKAVMKRIFIK